MNSMPAFETISQNAPINRAEKAGYIHIETARGDLRLAYPDTLFMKNLTLAVLQGRAYPVLELPGYGPQVIWDVGANIGAAAIYFHLHYPQAQIYAFEPSGRNFEYLQQNTAGLDPVQIFPYGLFDKTLRAPLYSGKEIPAQDSIVANSETGESFETVALVRSADELDRIGCRNISVLKLDTEGCEIPILNDLLAASDTIEMIYAEYHSERDRLELDRLLCPSHYLVNAQARQIHRGTLFYIAKPLAGKYRLAGLEIKRPVF